MNAMAGIYEPSLRAIDAAASTEANEVGIACGWGEKEWRQRSEADKEHWRRHVGAAVRAAYDVDFPSEKDAPLPHLKRVVGYSDLRSVVLWAQSAGYPDDISDALDRLSELVEEA